MPRIERRRYPEWDDFSIGADDGRRSRNGCTSGSTRPPTSSSTPSTEAGVDAGYASDGAPGPRRLHAGVLRRLPARPGRQQHRGRLPRATTASRARSTTCGCARRTSRRSTRLLRDDRPGRRLRGPPPLTPSTRTSSATTGSFSFVARRRADRARPHRVPGATTDAIVDAFHARRDRRRLHATTAPPASGRSTTPATTAPSCSTPTATTSRPSTTTAEQRPPRLDLLVVDEVVHALEDVEPSRPRRAPSAPPRSRAPAQAGTQPSGSLRAQVGRRALEGAQPRRDRPGGPMNPPV